MIHRNDFKTVATLAYSVGELQETHTLVASVATTSTERLMIFDWDRRKKRKPRNRQLQNESDSVARPEMVVRSMPRDVQEALRSGRGQLSVPAVGTLGDLRKLLLAV